MPRRKKDAQVNLAQLRDRLERGHSVSSIAQALGCSRSFVMNRRLEWFGPVQPKSCKKAKDRKKKAWEPPHQDGTGGGVELTPERRAYLRQEWFSG